jgi:dsDNA-specific endonuclease/ATPase MutS2
MPINTQVKLNVPLRAEEIARFLQKLGVRAAEREIEAKKAFQAKPIDYQKKHPTGLMGAQPGKSLFYTTKAQEAVSELKSGGQPITLESLISKLGEKHRDLSTMGKEVVVDHYRDALKSLGVKPEETLVNASGMLRPMAKGEGAAGSQRAWSQSSWNSKNK